MTIGCAKPNYQDPLSALNSTVSTKAFTLYSNYHQLIVQLEFKNAPKDSEMNTFSLKFYSAADPQTSVEINQDVKVILWMPSMGHGSSPVKVQKINSGLYQATQVYFIMPGDWEIRIQLKEQDNVVEQIVQKINIY